MLDKSFQQIEKFNNLLGRIGAVCLIPTVGLTFLVVVLRYFFSYGDIRLQEAVIYSNSLTFILCIPWVFVQGGHIRVDIFYNRFSPKNKNLLNIICYAIFGLVAFIALFYLSIDFVAASWQIKESSKDAGGLPGVFLLKSLVMLFAITLTLQIASEIYKSLRSHAA